MVSDLDIGNILADNECVDTVCQALIVSANDAGGQDNITAVVVDVLPRTSKCAKFKNEVKVCDGTGHSLVKGKGVFGEDAETGSE